MVVLRCLMLLRTAAHHPHAHSLLIPSSPPPPCSVLDQDETKADESADRWTRVFGWYLFWGVGVFLITHTLSRRLSLSEAVCRTLSLSNAVHHHHPTHRLPSKGTECQPGFGRSSITAIIITMLAGDMGITFITVPVTTQRLSGLVWSGSGLVLLEVGWGVETGWVGMLATIVVSYLRFWEWRRESRNDGLLDEIFCG